MTGFDVVLVLRNFKGYGLNDSDRIAKTLRLYVRSVRRASNLVFDLGCGLLAHALRCGAFGSSTADDIWRTQKTTLRTDDEYLGRPLFLASNARGYGLDSGTSLKWRSADATFKKLCQECGFYGSLPVRS